MTKRQGNNRYLTESELDWEYHTRTFRCPVCGAKPGKQCVYDVGSRVISHTGRYRLAVDRGLVPAFAGAS